MKKISTLFTMGMLVALPMTFTSCDDDHYYHERPWYEYYEDYSWRDRGDNGYNENTSNNLVAEAQCLRGHWQGTIVYEYTNEQGKRETAQFNADMEFDQYDNSNNPLRGRGREIDTAGDEMQELRFSWYVEDPTGNIYIKYDNSGKTYVLDAASRDNGFYLDTDYFNGFMIGVGKGNDDVLEFDFTRYTLSRQAKVAAKQTNTVKKTANNTRSLSNGKELPWRLLKR